MKKKLILLVAGEPSGDFHGANLIRDLKELDDSLDFIGAGGEEMRQAGLREIADMSGLALVGFGEVFGKIGKLRKSFRQIAEVIKKEKPDCFIPIGTLFIFMFTRMETARKIAP